MNINNHDAISWHPSEYYKTTTDCYINNGRATKIISIYRKYKELPPYIVKQIIDWSLRRDDKYSLSRSISRVRDINKAIRSLRDALAQYEQLSGILPTDIGLSFDDKAVFVDYGNGYAIRMDVLSVVKRINSLQEIRREIIREAKVNHILKKCANTFKTVCLEEMK